jgi:flagellar basal-body rod protein FlgF
LDRGLYIAATSLSANQKRLEVLSNNLANMNTTGYKKDVSLLESFPEVLLSKINDRPDMNFQNRDDSITYETDGEVHTAHAESGYFKIETPMGTSYVKDIRFIVDEDGYLKTFYKDEKDEYKTDGENYILDRNGNRIRGQGGNLENLIRGIAFYPPPKVIGTMNAGVKFQKIITDFSQGSLNETGSMFDLALKGPGFFKVQGEDGRTYYTRDGSFTIDNDGYMKTLEGYRLLGRGGAIRVEGEDFHVSKDGRISSNGMDIGYIDIVDIGNKEYLRKIGNNIYGILDDVNPEEIPFTGEVLQGFLEDSNVDGIKEMVEMITLLRDYEANQKVIKMHDEMLEKDANEIGRV